MDQDELDFLSREREILGDDAKLFGNPLIGEDGTLDGVPGTLDGVPATLDGVPGTMAGVPETLDGIQLGADPMLAHDSIVDNGTGDLEKRLESVHITAWKEDFDAAVQQRDLISKEKHQQKLANAKASLDRFYAEYNDKKQRQVTKNKEASVEQPTGGFWERVYALVEKDKSKDDKKRQKYRQLLLSLKNDKKAPLAIN